MTPEPLLWSSLCADTPHQPAVKLAVVGIGLCWPSSSRNINPSNCTSSAACSWTLTWSAQQDVSFSPTRTLAAPCQLSPVPPPLYRPVLQKSSHPTPAQNCI